MISLLNMAAAETTAATPTTPSVPSPTPTSAAKAAETSTATTDYIAVLVIAILLIVSIYMTIKFAINMIKSMKKTKEVLGNKLVISYVQGLNWKSSAFINVILINAIWFGGIITGFVKFSKVMASVNPSKEIMYGALVGAILTTLGLISFWITFLVIYLMNYNYEQYKHKKDLMHELQSIKTEEKLGLANSPETIKIDVAKVSSSNQVLARVVARMVNDYNKLDTLPLKKRYLAYLDWTFKVKLFHEANKIIEESEQEQQRMIQNVENILEEKLEELTPVEKEIKWMDSMDNKVKIIKENDEIVKSMNKEELEKKYEEYIYAIRSQDPTYQNVQKNSWLTYRDTDIEDLFFNPNSFIIYSLDEGKTEKNKSLGEFLSFFKKELENKFFKSLELDLN